MTGTTIVGWKDAESSRAALDWALNRHAQGTVLIAHVVPRNVPLVETEAANSPAARARIELIELGEQVRAAHPAATVHTELLEGDPVDSLASLSRPDDLIVVGSERSQKARRAHAWSVGARLSGSAPGPVAVVPSNSSAGRGVVVGVDVPAAGALRFAAEEARRRGEPLHAVRAWQGPPAWGPEDPPDEYLQSLQEMYGDILEHTLEGIVTEYPDVSIQRSVVQGEPREVLLGHSEGASLLVVGNHGLHGARRFFLGSVSHAVVLNAASPTVVVNEPHQN
jgi:nucleotide-binding universal stress UspA family protein